MSKYAIFVNTTDKFEDCWYPFFKLFSKFWPEFDGVIYLNTEYKEFKYPGLQIICVKNCAGRSGTSIPTWSECLKSGLDAVDNEIILYMQEDYFFNGIVNDGVVDNYAEMLSSTDIDCIHLTTASGGPLLNTKYSDLNEISKSASYRVSCQAALWKKKVLTKYIRKHESPWQFEKYATMRAHIERHTFYAIDGPFYGGNKVMPYVLTGIIQGKWKEEVVQLFKDNDIKIEFNNRGFSKGNVERSLYRRLKSRIPKLPKEIVSLFDLWHMRLTSRK